jgi:hypothetical protein
MAALGDVSTDREAVPMWYSMTVAIPVWPDVSTALPEDAGTPPSGGGFPGYFSFG